MPGEQPSNLAPGLVGEYEVMVNESNTAAHLGSGATPEMVRIIEQASVAAVDHLTFRAQAFDEQEKVDEGPHERFVLDLARFRESLAQRQAQK